MKWALSIPLLDGQIYGQIRKKLVDALGGRFKEVIIGGAAMNPEVEEFFHRIKFPFTIGYGMTECAPLISYAPGTNSLTLLPDGYLILWKPASIKKIRMTDLAKYRYAVRM